MKPRGRSRSKKPVSCASGLSPQQATWILRELPSSLSFHFYMDVGKPTDHVARSLVEFGDKLAANPSSPPAGSLAFHVKRGDFILWIKQAIGDAKLADTIAKVNPDEAGLAEHLRQIVTARVGQLKKTLTTYSLIPEDQCAVVRT
jgi:hypothetical protein